MADTITPKNYLDKAGVQDIFELILANHYTIAEVDELLKGFLKSGSLEGYATEDWVEKKGYLTEHQSLANYYTKGEADGKFLTEHQSLDDYAKKSDLPDVTKYPDKAEYDSESKKIVFKHGETALAGMEIDASDFIKDGMVESVTITNGKADGDNSGKKVLLITFNTDAGLEDIEIPLDGIFNADNYYTKTEIDGMFGTISKEDISAAYEAAKAAVQRS